MKKFLCILVAAALLVSFAACGSAAQSSAAASVDTASSAEQPASDPAAEEAPPTEEATPTEEASPAEESAIETEEAVEAEEAASVSEEPDAAESQYYFKDNVLVSQDVRIEITEVRVIRPGEEGNKYGDKPVIAFWYDTTNLSGKETVSASLAWISTFDAYQDTDPNYINELSVASLPDAQFRETQTAIIKEGGTVSNAVAYELDSETVPVILKARLNSIGEVIGEQEYDIEALFAASAQPEESASTESSGIPIDMLAILLEATLKDSFGDNCSVTVDGDIVQVDAWGDGVAMGAITAKAGNASARESWSNLVSSYVDLSNTINETVDSLADGDYDILLNILNDLNTDNVLLSIYNGVVIYDSVNGT